MVCFNKISYSFTPTNKRSYSFTPQTVHNGYDSLTVGSRLGMMRAAEGSLHYTINGEDEGAAIDGVPQGMHAVIDLYGVCGQSSVVHTAVTRVLANTENNLASSQVMASIQVSIQLSPELWWQASPKQQQTWEPPLSASTLLQLLPTLRRLSATNFPSPVAQTLRSVGPP